MNTIYWHVEAKRNVNLHVCVRVCKKMKRGWSKSVNMKICMFVYEDAYFV